MIRCDNLIVGAGITGLATANFLQGSKLIIEKANRPGGYCKTINKDGFTWDYSGHFFHFNDVHIKEYLTDNMDKNKILDIHKVTRVYHEGKYIHFPFQKNIHQLPYNEFLKCLNGLVNNATYDKILTFKDFVLAEFGSGISNSFLIPYNEKLYACDLDNLDKDSMGRFFPRANINEIVRNFVQPENKSYNDNFTYSTDGAEAYVKSLSSRLDQNIIKCNEEVVSIDRDSKVLRSNKSTYKYKNLISTIPLPRLCFFTGLEIDKNVFSSNKVLVYNLGFDSKCHINKYHWVYFASKSISFYRVGFYDNIFNTDKTSLYVEIGLETSSKIDKKSTLDKVLKDLREVGIITSQKLISYDSIVMDPAYVHINKKSEKEKFRIKKILKASDVFSIGRYGSWTYCSIEDNIIEAKLLAEDLNAK